MLGKVAVNVLEDEPIEINIDELCGRGERDTLRGDGDNR